MDNLPTFTFQTAALTFIDNPLHLSYHRTLGKVENFCYNNLCFQIMLSEDNNSSRDASQELPEGQAWVITVDMGYGHQRTAYPLRFLAPFQEAINANHYEGISKNDRSIWQSSQGFYEAVSRFKRIPLIGQAVFTIFDKFQTIWSFYPKRDLSKPTISLRYNYNLIKKGWGCALIKELAKYPLPIVSTFFTPAFMAEENQYPNNIFCVVCDTDIARTWAPLKAKTSRIKYLTPNQRTTERLILYGVPKRNIFQTGYPLPKENIGLQQEIAQEDTKNRLLNLDPKGRYRELYEPLIKKYLGPLPKTSNHPLTICFAIGGAGAQSDIAVKIVKSLKNKIKNGEIKVAFSLGAKEKVKENILKQLTCLKVADQINKNIILIFGKSINDYFQQFNQALRTTYVLWTKPSELSFYTALGLPIILAPTIGSQEESNRKWLLKMGSAIPQGDPNYTHQWLPDLIESGWLAEAALQGFIEAEKMGTYNIEKIIQSSKGKIQN